MRVAALRLPEFRRRVGMNVLRSLVCVAMGWLPLGTVAAGEPDPDPRFGAVEAYQRPQAAAELGVGWDRLIIEWFRVQPLGPQHWLPVFPHGLHSRTAPDNRTYVNHITFPLSQNDWAADAQAAGREVTALLMGTPGWATEGVPVRGVPSGLYLPVQHPENHWANFVRRMVGKHGGRIKHWIIWNEPDIAPDHPGVQFNGSVEDYYRLVKVAALAAREVDPEAVIHLGALTFWHDVVYGREPYLRRFLQVAMQDENGAEHGFFFDVATEHVYFNAESVYTIIQQQREILREFGLHKPVWMNEFNAAPMDDPRHPWNDPLVPVTLRQQASFIIQSTALAFAAGAERMAVYKLFDHVAPAYGLESYGLIRSDGSLRPAATAYRVAVERLSGFRRVQSAARPTHHLVTFVGANAVTHVVWARQAEPVTVRVSANPGATHAILVDQRGKVKHIAAENGEYRLELLPAHCLEDSGECVVGGEPQLLVEQFQCDPSRVAHQRKCVLWLAAGAGRAG